MVRKGRQRCRPFRGSDRAGVVVQSKAMSDGRFNVKCPCCEAVILVDSVTGAVLSHEEPKKQPTSFDELLGGLDKQKQMREKIFEQEMSSQKDRGRILEEKFKEAMKKAGDSEGEPYRNPLDMD